MIFIEDTEKENNKELKKNTHKNKQKKAFNQKMADYMYSCSAFGPQTSIILQLYMQIEAGCWWNSRHRKLPWCVDHILGINDHKLD